MDPNRRNGAAKLCPRCTFTQDRTLLEHVDAVMFNGRLLQVEEPPPPKPHGQIWIYFNREAPARMQKHERDELHLFRNLFNWTMTFKRDSDILMPYAELGRAEEAVKLNRAGVLKRFKGKKKLIAWIVSNCGDTPSKRSLLVKAMSAYLPIDIYGGCGNLTCPSDKSPKSHDVGTACRHKLAAEYKFYLAFENSLCQDYVTEKFFDVFNTDMVPITYSGANFSALGVPEGSYLNVANYASLEHLAAHVKRLGDRPEEYLPYLEARAGVVARTNLYGAATWCSICEKLIRNDGNGGPTYDDVRDWWNRTDNGRPTLAIDRVLEIVKVKIAHSGNKIPWILDT